MGLYSLVAWPPAELATWITQVQDTHGLAAFGAPHLNLRTPFEYNEDEGQLIQACQIALENMSAFPVYFLSWRRFPSTIFLELARTPELTSAHERTLNCLPGESQNHDATAYLPHLTLALGVCPWAEDSVWEAIKDLVLPVRSWTVDTLALTLENKGEIVELARYPLKHL